MAEQDGRETIPIRPGAHGKLWFYGKAVEDDQVTLLQECKDHFDGSMVSDHISRMERSDGSYHPECDTALKHASATSLNGKIS